MKTTDPKTPIDNSGVEPVSNHSGNRPFTAVVERYGAQRRQLLKGGLGLAIASFWGGVSTGVLAGTRGKQQSLGFTPVPVNRADTVSIPPGYEYQVIVPWGTPIHQGGAAYRQDAGNAAEDQQVQVGSHHDGMHFFPLDEIGKNNEGLLVMNHEYVDTNILHTRGPSLGQARPVDEVAKEMAAHGVSVLHMKKDPSEQWQLKTDSPYNRRITGTTVMDFQGPARGYHKLSTAYSPDATQGRGTLNNCAHGVTPWNTYLTTEENWAGYFVNRATEQPKEQRRYGVGTQLSRYRWETADSQDSVYTRFDVSIQGDQAQQDFRNEPNQFGWIVEIDPFDPQSTPQKRTAMGRFAHEGVIFALPQEGKPLVAYSGDDAKHEYIYKYVSRDNYHADTAGGHLLNDGSLFVARFLDDGRGEWLPLDIEDASFQHACKKVGVQFENQADVLINARTAADIAGATPMDRPEWGAVDPHSGEVYFTLTNNDERTKATVDAANPRPNNMAGHIIRWREMDGQSDSRQFRWDLFIMAGEQGTETPGREQKLTDDNYFACPDGLWFDPHGLLWIQTDMAGSFRAKGPYGNNQMLVANPQTGELKRFLVGPKECEVSGVVSTPDMKNLFVNIQHPGELSKPGDFTSHWPGNGDSRPRSATLVIRRTDGGVVGS